MASVLAVVAHPDDEVLGCGGTLALHAERGDDVTIVILGEGIRSRDAHDEGEVEQLHAAARRAAAALGVTDLRLASLPDNQFDSLPRLEVVKTLERLAADLDPGVVYTHHAGDLNVDHGVTAAAVLTAFRPLPAARPRTILAFETLSSTEWSFSAGAAFRPQWFVDIEASLERKLAALEEYGGEIRAFPHPRSAEGVRIAAGRWGATAGVRCAEAFEVLRIGPGPLPG